MSPKINLEKKHNHECLPTENSKKLTYHNVGLNDFTFNSLVGASAILCFILYPGENVGIEEEKTPPNNIVKVNKNNPNFLGAKLIQRFLDETKNNTLHTGVHTNIKIDTRSLICGQTGNNCNISDFVLIKSLKTNVSDYEYSKLSGIRYEMAVSYFGDDFVVNYYPDPKMGKYNYPLDMFVSNAILKDGVFTISYPEYISESSKGNLFRELASDLVSYASMSARKREKHKESLEILNVEETKGAIIRYSDSEDAS